MYYFSMFNALQIIGSSSKIYLEKVEWERDSRQNSSAALLNTQELQMLEILLDINFI